MLHVQLTTWEEVLCRLVKKETQRTEIDQTCRVVCKVEELHIAAIVYSELQTLRDIVNLGRDDRIRPVEVEFWQHLKQGHPFLELFSGLVVETIDLKHIGSNRGYSVSLCILLMASTAKR